jgi:co-chaperonin GroES (HSP10)
MKLTPLGKQIVGRVVDIDKTSTGLSLPTNQVKNVTVFILVDAIGPDVTKCKVGDVILYLKLGHCILRDGTHFGIVNEDDLIAIVSDLDPRTITVGGKKEKSVENGPPAPSRLIT